MIYHWVLCFCYGFCIVLAGFVASERSLPTFPGFASAPSVLGVAFAPAFLVVGVGTAFLRDVLAPAAFRVVPALARAFCMDPA